MNARDLVESWQAGSSEPLTLHEYAVRLPVGDAARLAALGDLFPMRGQAALVRDLLCTALDAVEAELPGATGPIVSETDEGDPLFAEAGPLARYRERVAHHLAALTEEAARRSAP